MFTTPFAGWKDQLWRVCSHDEKRQSWVGPNQTAQMSSVHFAFFWLQFVNQLFINLFMLLYHGWYLCLTSASPPSHNKNCSLDPIVFCRIQPLHRHFEMIFVVCTWDTWYISLPVRVSIIRRFLFCPWEPSCIPTLYLRALIVFFSSRLRTNTACLSRFIYQWRKD